MRSARVIAVAASATVLVAGCGGSSHKSPSKSRAMAVASAVNLRAADLPGYSATPTTSSSQINQLSARFAACAGESPAGAALADVSSDQFALGSGLRTVQFSSEVRVLPSQSSVARDLAAIRSDKARACIQRVFPAAVNQAGGAQLRAQIASVRAPAPGADGSYGYRVTIAVRAAGATFTVLVGELGAAVGKLEVTLNDFSIGTPITAATERHLFSLLVSRAAAHRL
jgi:hypothetical protein